MKARRQRSQRTQVQMVALLTAVPRTIIKDIRARPTLQVNGVETTIMTIISGAHTIMVNPHTEAMEIPTKPFSF